MEVHESVRVRNQCVLAFTDSLLVPHGTPGGKAQALCREAIEAGKKSTELRPNDQIGWTSLSLFYNRNGQIKEAEAAGTKAKILSWGGKIAQ